MNLDALLTQHNASPELSAAILGAYEKAMASALEEAHQTINELQAAAKKNKITIDSLTYELARLKRIRFAKTSESLKGVQLDLFAEDLDSDIAALAAQLEKAKEEAEGTDADASEKSKTPRKPRIKAGRQPLPAHLPRVVIRHELADCHCGRCGHLMVQIGEDVTEKLRVIPIRFEVEQHVRPKYACKDCETMAAAPVPASVIEGGMATPSLLSWVIVSKYTDHLPLYRLSQMAGREGLPLATSTLGEWVGKTSFELTPLYDRLKQMLLVHSTLHADETPIRQLDPGKGKTHRSYLWAYRNNDLDDGPPIVVFDYQKGRHGQHARDFLGDWRGYLCVDDYTGYKALFTSEDPTEITCVELGCMAHARRKFFDLFAANKSPMAEDVLKRISDLYKIEAKTRGLTTEERARIRKEETVPQLDDLKDFLEQSLKRAAPGGAAAKAINYSLKRWAALSRFAETGHLPIDNNPIERDIRPIAVGKKNWLHVGSERAGQRAAIIQSLLGTAKLNGINPSEWLESVLECLPTWKYSRLDELLPLRGWKSPLMDHFEGQAELG